MDDKQITVQATRDQIREFKKSLLWKDIKRELGSWKKGFRLESESIVDDAARDNPSTANVLMHIGDINGRGKAINYLISLPDIFLQILEGQKHDSRRK